MRHDGDRDSRYALSDGRDAREVLAEIEALLSTEGAFLNPFGEAAQYERAIFRRPEDDLEKLLQAANERWSIEAPLEETWTRPQHLFHEALRAETEAGSGITAFFSLVAHGVRSVIARTVGGTPDVRDSEQIAEQFMQVARARAEQDGGEGMEKHFERAREAVLDGVPTHYRRRVLERILDREEQVLRDSGAPVEEVQELEAARDERRKRGWQALTGKGASGRGR